MFHGNTTRASRVPHYRTLFSVAVLSLAAACFAILLSPSSAGAAEPNAAEAASTPTAAAEAAPKRLASAAVGSSPLAQVGAALPSAESVASKIMKGTLYCIGALLLVFAAIRRFAPQSGKEDNPIQIIARRSLGQKNSLLLIEVFEQKFIVGATGETLSLITAIDERSDFGLTLADRLQEEALAEQAPRKIQIGAQ